MMAEFNEVCEKISKRKHEIENILEKCNEPLLFCTENFEDKLECLKEQPSSNPTGTIENYPVMSVDQINAIFESIKSRPSWLQKAKPRESAAPKSKLTKGVSGSLMSLNQTRSQAGNSRINQSVMGSMQQKPKSGSMTNLNQTRNQGGQLNQSVITATPPQRPKVEWEDLISKIKTLQSNLSECKTENIKLSRKAVGEKRIKLINAFKESLTNIQQMKKWLENALIDTPEADSQCVFKPLEKLNENMKDIANIIADFKFIQENVELPIAALKECDFQGNFEEQIMSLVELLAELHKDDSEFL